MSAVPLGPEMRVSVCSTGDADERREQVVEARQHRLGPQHRHVKRRDQ